MTTGTADQSKKNDIFSDDVVFPTESLANPNNENEKNNSENNEEEEESNDKDLANEEEDQANKIPDFELIRQQLISQEPTDDQDNLKNEQQEANEPNEEDIDAVTEKFLSGEKVKTSDPTLLSHVVTNLEEKRDQLMIEGDFRSSLATQKAVDLARSKQIEAVKKQASKEELQNIKKKQDDLEIKYKEFEDKMKKEEEKLENEIKLQVQAMEKRHQKQIQEHDESWQDENKLRQYNRASQRLRVLRTQQQLLMNAKRFDEAEHVCKIADGVAQHETSESYKQLLTAYKNSRKLLEEKQQDEMDILLTASEQKRQVLQHQKEVLSQPFINRINNLNREEEIAKDPERLWILKYRNDEKKMKSYNGNQKNTKNFNQTQNESQDQTQYQTQTKTQKQKQCSIQYQYQEKKKTMPDYNKLDLPPLFGSTATSTTKKGKPNKKATQKVNTSTQKTNDDNDISQKEDDIEQNINDTTQKVNPPAKKANKSRPRKTSNEDVE